MSKRNQSFFTKLALAKSYMVDLKRLSMYSVLEKVEEFVDGGEWTSRPRYREYVKVRTLSDANAASVLGISEATLRNLRMQCSNKLNEVFGERFFESVYANDLDYCESVLAVVSGGISSESLCSASVKMAIGGVYSSDSSYLVSDCLRELEFLAKFSDVSVQRELRGIDKGKLAFLLSVADGCGGMGKKVELARLWGKMLDI